MSDALAARLAQIRQTIAQSAAGRSVRLVAASKFQPDAAVERLWALGVTDFGENYPQALAKRVQHFGRRGIAPRWHLLGGLQRNKASLVAPFVDVVHSLDGVRVAEALSHASVATGRESPISVFVQVALQPPAGAARRGVSPEQLGPVLASVRSLPGLCLVGLMVLPPAGSDPVAHFRGLRTLRDALSTPGGPLADAPELSMGMSSDFSLAIREGATVVRVGSALFGPRA